MTNVTAAKAAMRDLGVKAAEIAGSDRTQSEKKSALDKLEVDMKSFSDAISLDEQLKRLAGSSESPVEKSAEKAAENDGPRVGAKSLMDRVTGSEDYTLMQKSAQLKSHFTKTFEFDDAISVKAAANTITEGTAPAGYGLNGTVGVAATPNFLPGIVDLRFQKLTIADLMASGSTSSPLISYIVETGWNDNAAATAEGGLKPQSDGSFVRVVDQVGKITNRLKMTDEMVEDQEQFRSFLQNRLVWSIQRQEEIELLNGTGYPSVKGLLTRTGLLAAVTASAAAGPNDIMEKVFAQITQLRTVSFVEPDAFVMHPLDWETIRLAKDKNDQYYAGGPFQYGPYGGGMASNEVSLWGLRGIITTAMPVGSVLVGGFQENAQIWRKKGITLEFTNSNEDDFNHDIISARAEERVGLSVYRPQGFGLVSVGA